MRPLPSNIVCRGLFSSTARSVAVPRVQYPLSSFAPTHQRAQIQPLSTRTMSSATTFYDFEPVDSTSPLYPSTKTKLTLKNRNRQTLPPLQPKRQSNPRRQHGLQMRLHPAIRLPRNPLQIPDREVPRHIHNPRLSLQPIRLPRPRLQRRHPVFLPGELRSQFPRAGQVGCEWGAGGTCV